MEDPKVKFVLLVPVKYNDGRAVPESVLDDILDDVFGLAHGYTIAGTVKGAYQMSHGAKKEDESLELWIAVRTEEIPALRKMVRGFATILGQESMYLERTGGSIEILPRANESEHP
jgi:hypothetical protein